MLVLNGLCSGYGKMEVLHGISLNVEEGEIVSLIGANGAGKTTTLFSILGMTNIFKGNIRFLGENITSKKTEDIVQKGIVCVPEGRRVFGSLTVIENLKLGGWCNKSGLKDSLEYVFSLFPKLFQRKNQRAETFSGGEQQMLALARGLMAKPKLLLLDEPSLGLSPIMVSQIFDCLKKINKDGVTILLVEQNIHISLSISNKGYVLETGKIVISGNSSQLKENPIIKEAYLGI